MMEATASKRRLLFDIETNGLLSTPWEKRNEQVSRIFCAVAVDVDSEELWRFTPDVVHELAPLLESAGVLLGHNIVDYDLPVLQRLLGWKPGPEVDLLDTRVAADMAYPIKSPRLWRLNDKAKAAYGEPPKGEFVAGNSLHMWAWRVGDFKADFKPDWSTVEYSQEMMDYCEQDVMSNLSVYRWLVANSGFSEQSMILDSNVAAILRRQRVGGVRLDQKKALALATKLQTRRDELKDQLREIFPPWYVSNGITKPKKTMNKKAYGHQADGETPIPVKIVEGCAYEKIKLKELNPGSRFDVHRCLSRKYGWKPKKFNDDGSAKVTRAILQDLVEYPEAAMFAEYEELNKKVGMILEGDQAWLRKCTKDGILHGRVQPSGAKTGRMSHSHPNLAQVPKVGNPYGAECRECFGPVNPGWVQVGADASGLELRGLAHYTYRWDKGELVEIVTKGDVHTTFQNAFGLHYRDNSKTAIYALMYGAQDPKLGQTVHADMVRAAADGLIERAPKLTERNMRVLGTKARARLMSKLTALKRLTEEVAKRAPKKFVRLPDGRIVWCTAKHSALNMLIQGTGAVIMKQAQVILDRSLQLEGLKPETDYEFMLTVHDEFQLQCRKDLAELIAKMAVSAIELAGEQLGIKCPLTGEAKIGMSWRDTH